MFVDGVYTKSGPDKERCCPVWFPFSFVVQIPAKNLSQIVPASHLGCRILGFGVWPDALRAQGSRICA